VKSELLLKFLHDKELHSNRPFNGCSETEINLLEQEMGTRLPESYRQYLLAVYDSFEEFLFDSIYQHTALKRFD
jgi:hypothetical protein